MDQEIKQKWVKALRSGEYTQTKGCLYNGVSGYCCLGVLCDIMKVSNFGPKIEDNSFLPTSLAKKVGLSLDRQRELSKLNDCGKDFNYIADYIEEHY